MIVRIRTTLFFAVSLLFLAMSVAAQPITDKDGDIGIGTLVPHQSALLDLSSTTKGFLLPQMTAQQRDRIVRPSSGLLLYNLNDSLIEINCGDEVRPIWCPFVIGIPGGGLSAYLTSGAIWYGGGDATAIELPIGVAGSLLSSDGANPSWTPNPGGLLPAGTVNDASLRWDGTSWVENTNLRSDAAGNTQVSGTMTVGGNQMNNGDLSVNGNVDFPLTADNVWLGNGLNRASELPPGVDGSVFTIAGTTPSWTANPGGLLPAGTVNNSSLRWDGTSWVENTNLRSDAGGNTEVSGTMTVGGNQVNNGDLSVNGNVDFPLTADNVWLGNGLNRAAELPPGVDGSVFTIAGTTPSWTANPGGLLPAGTVNDVSLRWDGTSWVENTNLRSDAAGNTEVSGTMTVGGNQVNNGDLSVNGNVDFPLTADNVWLGNGLNRAAELPPGVDGSVFTITGTTPSWTANPGGLLPAGTVNNSSLRWDGTSWVENTNLRSDAAGNTEVSGTMTVGGNQVNNGDLSVNGSVDFPLTADNVWLGDGLNRAAELPPGVDGSVFTIAGTTPSWTANPGGLLPAGTVNNASLRWDGTSWVENTNLRSDAGGNTQVSGTMTVGGNQVNNGDLSVNGSVDFPLTADNVWLGDGLNRAAELPPGVDGSVFTITGTTPSWTANPGGLLPAGTVNNSSLRWDGTSWVENTNLRSDAAGNTEVSGTMTVGGNQVNNGDLSVNGSVDFPLTADNVWLGDGLNRAAELPPGVDGSVFTITGTTPSWTANPGGLLPAGTVNNASLRWDGTSWVENTNLRSDAGGNTTINGGIVSLPNIPIAIAGTDVLITDGGGNLQTINVNSLIGNATLTQNAMWTGDGANNPTEVLSTNVPQAILSQNGGGTPVWTAPDDTPFWLLTGNVATNPGTDFLGTRDAQSLVFRTNNIERARFDETTGGDFVPGSDNLYSLGSALLRWRDLYLGPGSLHITSTVAETVTARDWSFGIEESRLPTALKRGNLQILSDGDEVVNVTPDGRVGIGPNFDGAFGQSIDATLTVQGDAIITRRGLSSNNRHLHLADQSDQPYFFRYFRVNEADFRMYEALNDEIRFETGRGSGLPNLFRGGYRFDIVNSTETKPILYIDSTGLGVNISGAGADRPLHYVHIRNRRANDEMAAVYGVVEERTTNQAIGLWGDASNAGNNNTGTIGVLATGSGHSTPNRTNIAFQLNDGELTMGRTTQTGAAYTVVEGATGGVMYSAQGPSGVIELTLGAGGDLPTVAPTAGVFQNLGTIIVSNRYASSTSIVLVNVLSKVNDTAAPNPENAVFMVDVDNRANGSFVLQVGMIPTATNVLNFENADVVRIGYTVINPSR